MQCPKGRVFTCILLSRCDGNHDLDKCTEVMWAWGVPWSLSIYCSLMTTNCIDEDTLVHVHWMESGVLTRTCTWYCEVESIICKWWGRNPRFEIRAWMYEQRRNRLPQRFVGLMMARECRGLYQISFDKNRRIALIRADENIIITERLGSNLNERQAPTKAYEMGHQRRLQATDSNKARNTTPRRAWQDRNAAAVSRTSDCTLTTRKIDREVHVSKFSWQ